MTSWLQFIKYKLSLAVTITGIAGYLIYAGSPDFRLLLTAIGIFLLSGGASGLNQYQEREYDQLMERTRTRPLPAGKILPLTALIVSVILILTGSIILFSVYWMVALLGILNVVFYNLFYTKLKRHSYLAILPGALVGALPPLIGWTAAGGILYEPTILFLALLIFMWQIPHFWLLIIKYHEDYARAGFKSILRKMDEQQVRRIVFVWIAVSSLFSLCYPLFGINLNVIFGYALILIILLFIYTFYRLIFGPNQKLSMAFILSNIFITFIFTLFAIGTIIN